MNNKKTTGVLLACNLIQYEWGKDKKYKKRLWEM